MNKRKSIIITVSILFIIILSIFLFVPSVWLFPSPTTKVMLENNEMIMNNGLFYVSADKLSEVLEIFSEYADSNDDTYKSLEKAVKRDKGLIVNNMGFLNIQNIGSLDSPPHAAEGYIYSLIQTDDSVTMDGEEYHPPMNAPLPKGYKIY